jgi:hypothetical protein
MEIQKNTNDLMLRLNSTLTECDIKATKIEAQYKDIDELNKSFHFKTNTEEILSDNLSRKLSDNDRMITENTGLNLQLDSIKYEIDKRLDQRDKTFEDRKNTNKIKNNDYTNRIDILTKEL